MNDSLLLENPQKTVEEIIAFLQTTFQQQKKTEAVIGVSGGIDSALSLTLLSRALPVEHIWPFFLPYENQSIIDAQTICSFLQIPEKNWQTRHIENIVAAAKGQQDNVSDIRLGNLMARSRMMIVFDFAKAKDALVCGTENKSEHYLGYFTRFGDAASDIEPISHLYKTQVRQLVTQLQLPAVFLEKAPSAGLWSQQTDESEMGFSYEVADQVLFQLIDQKKAPNDIQITETDPATIQKIVSQVQAMHFKLVVPYMLERSLPSV